MNRSPKNTIHRIRGSTTSWLNISEVVEPIIDQTLTWFEVLGYTVLLQSDIVSGRYQSILQTYHNGILADRFRQAMRQINPMASQQQIETVLHQLTTARTMPMLQQNRQWHRQLLAGIPVQSAIDSSRLTTLKLVDFTNLLNNDWLVIRSFPVVEGDYQHCLDLVVFINGFPLAMFHGLHGGEESWSLRAAYLQLQAYQSHLPKFFSLNELLIVSNGVQSRMGSLTASWKQFTPIQAVSGEELSLTGEPEMTTLIQGIFDKRRLFEILQHFILFQQGRTQLTKKLLAQPFCTVTLSRTSPRRRFD